MRKRENIKEISWRKKIYFLLLFLLHIVNAPLRASYGMTQEDSDTELSLQPASKSIRNYKRKDLISEEEQRPRGTSKKLKRLKRIEAPHEDHLWEALQNKKYEKVKKLIKQGVEVNTSDYQGNTPLQYARQLSHHD